MRAKQSMTMGHGKNYAEVLLARADEALLASQTLLGKCLLADTISRAYYAMYYATHELVTLFFCGAPDNCMDDIFCSRTNP
jgi:hypothetical protein